MRNPICNSLYGAAVTSLLFWSTSSVAQSLPDPTSPEFCVKVQQLLADTEIRGNVTVFDNMPAYRSSKPAPDPLLIYQVVTYDEGGPVVVSCKVKTADHLREVYGDDAAGEQSYCPSVTELNKADAVAQLQKTDPEAAARAEAIVVDQNEPYAMGSKYLADYELSYVGEDGAVHIQSPGLQTDWESWMGMIMPDRLMGQTYCHLPTVEYIVRLATGEIEPGRVQTTVDDAQTQPL